MSEEPIKGPNALDRALMRGYLGAGLAILILVAIGLAVKAVLWFCGLFI